MLGLEGATLLAPGDPPGVAGTPAPGATATDTVPPSPAGMPVPPPPTPTPFPTPISGFQQSASPTSFYGLDSPSATGWSEYSSPPSSNGAYRDSCSGPSGVYFQVWWEDNNQYTGNPTAIADNGSYYFGLSPLSPSTMTTQSVGGISCVRGNSIWTGEYGNQERGAVLGCESPAGRMYAIILYADAGLWSNSESAYFEPMLGAVW